MNILNEFLDKLYISKIRSISRRLGFMKFYSLGKKIQTICKHVEYKKFHPQSVGIRMGGYDASFLVGDINEYTSLSMIKKDKKLIQYLIKYAKQGRSFWDIGANIGVYTIFLAKTIGDKGNVISFEPEEKCFKRLLQNIEYNKLANVKAFKIALGKENKKTKLRVSDHFSSGSHSLFPNPNSDNNFECYEDIKVYNGDSFRKEQNISVPNIIKIDVEGAEEDVILGLSETLNNENCKVLLCEVHFSILETHGLTGVPLRIEDYLKSCGFQFQRWIDHSHLIVTKDDGIFH
ncbi:MAG: hypothetical protein A3B68_07885 [Candidatus Melainabacteria bacterium RIFCSPHIGHO2_02_FULL_34_12]|nr:MAG: hypothetical protein A3B68_07885 [Candidatus Melainabacteria bacterium RIFCSPHIGHO2_02_FULL_34_12]